MLIALVGLLGAISGVLGTIFVSVMNNKASPYSALSERVLALEQRVAEQDLVIEKDRLERRMFIDHIQDLHEWVEDGAVPPPPTMPKTLLNIVNGAL